MKRMVLFSHAKDADPVERLEREIERQDVSVFNPHHELAENKKFLVEMRREVERSQLVAVAVSSVSAFHSSNAGLVIGMASAMGKDVVILTPSGAKLSAIANDISGFQRLRFDKADPRSTADSIVQVFEPA